MSVAAGAEGVTLEMEYNGDQDGVDVSFKATQQAIVCPDATGHFEASATIDVATSKGTAGTKTTFELKVDGQVDDDANLASTTRTTRTQAADFAGGKGQFTSELVSMMVLMQVMFHIQVGDKMIAAATTAWQSGRCVQLNAVPSSGPGGLEPSTNVTITASPKSKVDGAPAGGTVTATLTEGAASVSPSATKVPADATFTYVAPGETNATGRVALEARSRRGVAKAVLDFNTTKTTYVASGGTQVTFSGTVDDLGEPFALDGEGPGFTVRFSFVPEGGSASGSLTYTGSGGGATLSGSGTYTISGADPDLVLAYSAEGCADVGVAGRHRTRSP